MLDFWVKQCNLTRKMWNIEVELQKITKLQNAN